MDLSLHQSIALKIKPMPLVFKTVDKLRAYVELKRLQGKSIGFVPTMGNLHRGHLDLVEKAAAITDIVVVSIFVNPMQFGPNEDFDAYPHSLQSDRIALSTHPCKAIFVPTVREIYPKGINTEVDVPGLSTILCGQHRPGHFKGVATVVTKLINIIQPAIVVLGNKDYQQLQVIRTMVTDLLMPVEVIGADTTRETNGLAMSSRNTYLSETEYETASLLYKALNIIGQALLGDQAMTAVLKKQKDHLLRSGFILDYLEIRDANDLSKSYLESETAIVLVAAKLGRARLIDNLIVHL